MTSHPRKHYYYTSNHLRRRINIDYAAAALERCSVLAIRRLCGYCGYRGAAAYSHTWDKDYICASASHWRGKYGDQRRVKPSLREHYNFAGWKTPRRRRSRESECLETRLSARFPQRVGVDVVNFPRKLLNREKYNAYRYFVSRDVPPTFLIYANTMCVGRW